MAALLLVGMAAALAGPPNLLHNGDFEAPTLVEGGLPGGWTAPNGDAHSRRSVVPGGVQGRGNCLLIEAPSLPPGDPSVSVEQGVPAREGESYVFEAWVKGEPGTQGMLAVAWIGDDGHWIDYVGSAFTYGPDWAPRKVMGVAPLGAVSARVRIDLRSAGKAWIDDATLVRRIPAKLLCNPQGGEVGAGTSATLKVRVLAEDGQPLAGCAVLGSHVGGTFGATTSAAGVATLVFQATPRAGNFDVITLRAAPAETEVKFRVVAASRPVAVQVSPDTYAPSPGQEVRIAVRLVGAMADPSTARDVPLALEGSWEGEHRAVTDSKGSAVFRVKAPKELWARWVPRVTGPSLAGEARPLMVCPQLSPGRITLDRQGYFTMGQGRPFLPLGGLYGNRVHAVAAGVSGSGLADDLTQISEAQRRAWFSYLRDQGITCLRVMLRNPTREGVEPMDLIGEANLTQLHAWEAFMASARPFGIRFLVTLHESWYATYGAYFDPRVLERCVLPSYRDRDLGSLPAYRRRFLVDRRMLDSTAAAQADPDVMACQRDYLEDLIPRLRGNPDIFAYELENEQPSGAFDWTSEQIATIRRYDPVTPIGVSHLGQGLLSADPSLWFRRTSIDFLAYHLYPSEPVTRRDYDYGVAVALCARYASAQGPAFAGESFGDEWLAAAPASCRLGARDTVWGQLLGRNAGCLFWDASDLALKEFRLASRLAEEVGVGRFQVRAPAILFRASDAGADPAWFRTRAPGRAEYSNLSHAVGKCLDLGLDFGFARQGGRDPAEAVDAPLVQRLVLTKGWQAQLMGSQEGDRLLAYIRNVGGGPVQIQKNERAGWTRTQSACSLRMTLPAWIKARSVRLVDLDTGTETRAALGEDRTLDLGMSAHDWALLVTP